jgi:hypothetical protein
MTTRLTLIMAAAGFGLVLAANAALAQGTGSNAPVSAVPSHKVTPSRYMAHPRPVPEQQTTESLNQMSLNAAQQGVNFTPPAPGTEHKQP